MLHSGQKSRKRRLAAIYRSKKRVPGRKRRLKRTIRRKSKFRLRLGAARKQANPNWIIGVGYVNRPDLLRLALNSISAYRDKTVVIDNSPDRSLRKQLPVEVYTPHVPLTFSQTMNALFRLAGERGCKTVLFLHNDAKPMPGTFKRFVNRIKKLLRAGTNWGAAFTSYHALAAFNLAAVRKIGGWDTLLPHYFADNDYYRRMRLSGFELIETGLPVLHYQGGSATIKSDQRLMLINHVTFPLYEEYYKRKWGGVPGQEIFFQPYNLPSAD